MMMDVQWFSDGVILYLCDRLGGRGLSHFSDKVDHLDSAFSAVGALVACFCPGTLDGLLDVLCSNYAEHHRDAAGKRYLCDTL